MFHTIIGIDIWPERVVISEAKVSFNSSKIIRSEEKPYSDIAGLKEAIREVSDPLAGKAEVRCSFSPQGVSFRYLRFPFHDRRKIEQTLPFQMEALLPFDAADCLFSYLVVEQQGESSVVLAAAVPKSAFAELLAILEELQLKPHCLTFRPLPLLAYLAPNGGESSLLLLSGENEQQTLFAAWQKKALLAVRSLHCPSFDAVDLCSQIDDTLHGVRNLTDIDFSPRHVVSSLAPGVNQKLLAHFSSASERRMPAALKETTAHADALVLTPNNRLPLAMRPVSPGRLQKLQQYKIPIILSATGLLLLFILGGLNLYVKNRIVDRQYTVLQKNIEDVYRTTFPESLKIVDPVLQFQQKIAEIQNTETGHSELHTSSPRILAILSSLSDKLPDNSKVTLSRTLIDQQSLLLQGDANSYNALDHLQKDLQGLDFVSRIRLKEAQLNRKNGKVHFEIELERTR